MKKYYIGTTIENLVSILQGGFISTTPPHRVWQEYSQDYVYLVPYLVDEDHELHEEAPEVEEELHKILSVAYAFEQADFAVYELGHTKRVVLEITGIEESLLSKDSDAQGINAVKYPKNIPVSCISNIMIDKNDFSEEINLSIAITKYFQKYQDETHVIDRYEDVYSLYDEQNDIYVELDEDEVKVRIREIEEEIDVKHIGLVFTNNEFGCSNDLENISYDLREFLDMGAQFHEYTVEEFESLFQIHSIAS